MCDAQCLVDELRNRYLFSNDADTRELFKSAADLIETLAEMVGAREGVVDAADRMRAEITHYHTLGTDAYDAARKAL